MKLGYNLNLQQQQKLVMTPELKQSIEILQYTALELNEFINEELMTNPILEKSDDNFDAAPNESVKNDYEEKYKKIDWKQVSDDIQIKSKTRKYQEVGESINYDNFLASEETLHEHLLAQLQYTLIDEAFMPIATYLIHSINPSGYLKIDADYVVNHYGIDYDILEDIILTIQTFDPIGVGARDLVECLLIQVVYNKIEDRKLIYIIIDHLEDIANNKLDKIAKTMDMTIDEVKNAIEMIRQLEPKPGRAYASLQDITYIKPDVTLRKDNDEYTILVNENTAPKLYISDFYKKMLNEASVNEQASDYISKKLHSALRIIKSIEQRRNTIYRVVEAILEFQLDFFEKGPIHLKTLTLKDIANHIGVHESTVSRATNGKYLQAPSGLYELKYFFQSGVSTNRGDGISAESIKIVLKEMIEKEPKDKPLSDQAISIAFDKIGVKISRRTVAKYRTELNIPSTSKRKEF
ncbi:MAG: RNA polymerase factor sigma-54 [Clostridia bacterium]|nr:RNA polymerase factor sigma-54 [Clostridia bacterium]